MMWDSLDGLATSSWRTSDVVSSEEGYDPPGLASKDTLRMHEYLFDI